MALIHDQKIDLTSGDTWTGIWRLSWPMLIMMVFNFFVGFTDVYVAGFISPKVQAAVGYITQIYFIVVIVANAISIGALALIARAVGAGDQDKAISAAGQSLTLGLIVSIAFTAACLLFYRPIIAIAGFPSEIRDIAETFLIIFSFALGPNYLLIISNAVFRAGAEVKKPLVSMLVLRLVNIALDFFLVLGISPFPKLGYPGIAWSTVSATLLGTVLNLIFLGTSHRWRSIYSRRESISWKSVVSIFKIAWPAAFLQIAWNLASLTLYGILGRLKESSIVALAAIANGLRIEAIIYLPAFALNMAASGVVGQNLGAGNPDRAEQMGWKIASVGIAVTSLIAVVIFIWAEYFASILTGESPVLAETTLYLRINMLSEPFMALSTVMGGGLQGAGDTRTTMWVIIFAMWFIRIPLSYFLALTMGYGAAGVWSAMAFSMSCQGLIMAWWFKKGNWKKLEIK
jgi:putative MATE family efflux protein